MTNVTGDGSATGDQINNGSGEGSGASVTPPPQDPPAGDEVVPKKEFESVVRESIKRKQELADIKKQLEEQNKRLEGFKVQGMKDKEMWKELAETKEKEAEAAKSELSNFKKAYVDNEKFGALKIELMKMGMIPEALNDIGGEWVDLCEVETTSTGRINVLNAKSVAETLKAKKPYFFGKPNTSNVNTQTPSVGGSSSGAITPATVLELGRKYEKTKSEADRVAYHNAAKTLAAQEKRTN